MPSPAFTNHLIPLLSDADTLFHATAQFPAGVPGRNSRVSAMNRAVVVMSVSAWEAFIEELIRVSLEALRPTTPNLGIWPALNASARSQLGRFNTPSSDNVRSLISDTLGLPDVRTSWVWQNCSSAQAVQRLGVAMSLRHQIAHGVNPRPIVETHYASRLPDFFRRLGRCTDATLRQYLVDVLGIPNPWPI